MALRKWKNYDTYDVEEDLNEFHFGINLKYGGLIFYSFMLSF